MRSIIPDNALGNTNQASATPSPGGVRGLIQGEIGLLRLRPVPQLGTIAGRGLTIGKCPLSAPLADDREGCYPDRNEEFRILYG